MHSYSKPKIAIKILSLAMLFLIALPLACGCTSDSEMKSNIEITPKKESYTYDEEAISYAKNAIYTCLYNYEALNSTKISEKDIAKMKSKAEKIQKSLPATISQKDYKSLFYTISQNSKDIASGFDMINGDDIQGGFEKLKASYLAINKVVDEKYIGEIAYNIILATLDEKHQAQMDAYQKYGYEYMLEKANEYLEMKSTVQNDIGKNNISRIIRYFFFFGDLYYGTAFEGETLKSFTDEEALIFIKSLDLRSLTISEKGYLLIYSVYGESVVGDMKKTFFDKVMFEAYRNGDNEKMAIATKEFVLLIAEAQNSLTLEDISILRNGEGNKFIYKLIEGLDDDGWSRFDRICKQEINKDEYVKIAKEYYGSDFEEYLQSMQGASIDELKQACGTDSFNQTLKEYIFGICPAFSYNMNF